MASKHGFRLCKVCGSAHGRVKCPVADLNAQQELTAAMEKTDLIDLGLTPQLEYQIREIRRGWKKQAEPKPLTQRIAETIMASPELIDATTAAERLRQAWGVRA